MDFTFKEIARFLILLGGAIAILNLLELHPNTNPNVIKDVDFINFRLGNIQYLLENSTILIITEKVYLEMIYLLKKSSY
ncbi:MAG: hypothetical protein Tsb0014_16650 [Pleurocapsa sp.]